MVLYLKIQHNCNADQILKISNAYISLLSHFSSDRKPQIQQYSHHYYVILQTDFVQSLGLIIDFYQKVLVISDFHSCEYNLLRIWKEAPESLHKKEFFDFLYHNGMQIVENRESQLALQVGIENLISQQQNIDTKLENALPAQQEFDIPFHQP